MPRLVRALICVAGVLAVGIAVAPPGSAEESAKVSEWETFIQAVATDAAKIEMPPGVSNVVTSLTKFPEKERDTLLDWLRTNMTRAVLTDKFDRVGRYQAFERCLATGTECDELRKLAARGNWGSSSGAPAATEPPAQGPADTAGGAATTPPAGTTPPPADEPEPDPTLPVLAPNETACCRFTNPFSGAPSCSATQDPRDCRDRLRGEIMLKHSCVNTETCVAD